MKKKLVISIPLLFLPLFYWNFWLGQHLAWQGYWWFFPTLILSLVANMLCLFAPLVVLDV